MQDVIWDATPSMKKKKEEQFLTPVITLSGLAKIGAGRKFTFNKACQELMNIQGEDRVSFGFTPDGEHIFLRKATGTQGFKLTKTCSISDKKTYEFIAKRLNLNTEVENHFDVVVESTPGVFEMTLMNPFRDGVEILDFKKMELGEISEEPILEADLSSIPETPEGGAMYVEENASELVDIEVLEDEEVFAEESVKPSPTTEEDEWN